jgi:hypothetical protein
MAVCAPKFKNHIERLKFNMSVMEIESRAKEARLIASEALVEGQQRMIDSNSLLLQALQTQHTNAQMELARIEQVQTQHVMTLQAAHLQELQTQHTNVQVEQARLEQVPAQHIFSMQAEHDRVEVALVERQRARNEREEACTAFEAVVVIALRQKCEANELKTAAFLAERRCLKKKEANAKRTVLRSFNWREANVDASVLRGAIAFWAATPEGVLEENEEKKRMPNKARKKILKVIVEQGFNGELHDELEKDFVKKKRFKVFTLVRKSDLESKFGGEAIGSISHCENGHEKHMRGLIPSSGSIGNMQRKLNKIVSLRHNRHNGNGGAKRTRDGAPTELCPEFWSLGQWLGRWSMWQLGLADDMDPDRHQYSAFTIPNAALSSRGSSCESDVDEDYALSPRCNVSDEYSCTDESDPDISADILSDSDDNSSVASDAFVPLTPCGMPHMECRSLRLLPRNCVRSAY